MSVLLYATHPTVTKPLTPSHVKGLVWFDLVARATGLVTDVTTLANRVTCDATAQNLGFWHYLDSRFPHDAGFWADKEELWIAEQYVRYHAEGHTPSGAALGDLRRRVEEDRWMHPASRRVLDVWLEQCRVLGVDERSLTTWEPLGMGDEEALETLAELDVLLDARQMGGAVHLDFTPDGMNLRQIVDEHGTPNYVLLVLRELLPVWERYDTVVLGFDSEALHDFELVARVLRHAGARVVTIPVDRVQLPGVEGTTRTGGWEAYTLARLIDRLVPEFGVPAFQLGVRMYFVLHVGRRSRAGAEFDPAMIARFVRRAQRIVDALPTDEGLSSPEDAMRALWETVSDRECTYADPNRLLQRLVKRAPGSAPEAVLLRDLVLGLRDVELAA
jgi:hypothetical protein